MILVAFLGAVALAQTSMVEPIPRSLNLKEDFFTSQKSAYALLPPEVVGNGWTTDFQWSNDGRYLSLVEQTERDPVSALKSDKQERPEQSITIYDLQNKTHDQVLKLRSDAEVVQCAWLAGTSVALFVYEVHEPSGPANPQPVDRYHVLRYDAKTRLQQEIFVDGFPGGGDDGLALELSPLKPIGYILEASFFGQGEGRKARVFLLHDLATTLTEAPQLAPSRSAVQFSEKGDMVLMTFDRPKGASNGQAERSYFAVNPDSGEITHITTAPKEFNSANLPAEFLLEIAPVKVTIAKTSKTIKTLWIECAAPGKSPRALVCARPTVYSLAPTNKALAYASEGAVFVRRIEPVSLDLYTKMLYDFEKAEALSNAKQAVLGLTMFCLDNDDKMPGAGDVSGLLDPYVKNPDLLSKFNYTYNGGGLITDIKDPSNTVLGYVDGPGGRAYAYADGTVRWKNNP